jgi:hypothetical protein
MGVRVDGGEETAVGVACGAGAHAANRIIAAAA